MQPNLETERIPSQEQPERQIDLVSIYRTVLRVVAHLEKRVGRAEVLAHLDTRSKNTAHR